MKFWVGVTDNQWYNYLSEIQPDEVNFWQPSGSTSFKVLEPGGVFLFKLKRSRYIVGGGFFVRHSFLPLSLAWDAFEEKNGAETFEAFRALIMPLRTHPEGVEPDPVIGCIILTEPFFFRRDEWIQIPENFSLSIQKGKTYDTSEGAGAALWAQVHDRLTHAEVTDTFVGVAEDPARYSADYLTRARLGQGAFRVLVTDAYNRRCSITGERTLPVLDAAHIKPFAKSGPHRIDNGLLLRTDLHKLFDLGYMTITTDYHVMVSRRIKEEFHNGQEYYALKGKQLHLPSNRIYRPSRDYIEWHNQEHNEYHDFR